ncbi:BrnT family toxin [Myxococcota bacterium]|nr:BrnT family toxin [Myxococcota bacterium]
MDVGYVWDESKYEKTKEKHGVTFAEVVYAMEDPNSLDEQEFRNDEERWVSVGSTWEGRVIAVVYNCDEFPLYRIITAFQAEGSWLDEYRKT